MKVRAGNWHGNVIRFDFRPLGLEGWRGTACIVAWGQGQRRGRTAVVLPVRTSATDRCVGSGSCKYCSFLAPGLRGSVFGKIVRLSFSVCKMLEQIRVVCGQCRRGGRGSRSKPVMSAAADLSR